MTNLTVLPTPNYRHQRSEDTIRILKNLLERAEQGEILEIAVAWINNQGRACNKSSPTEDCVRFLGAIAMLQYHAATLIGEDTLELDDPPEAS